MKNTLRVLMFWTLVTGLAYPAVVTGVSQAAFGYQANGSFDGQHSSLMMLPGSSQKLFWARPSACDNAPESAAATQLGPTSAALVQRIQQRRKDYQATMPTQVEIPVELVTSSGSGLDPDISVEGAKLQIPRVARGTGLSPEQLQQLIVNSTRAPQWGLLGTQRVNVPDLNREVERLLK